MIFKVFTFAAARRMVVLTSNLSLGKYLGIRNFYCPGHFHQLVRNNQPLVGNNNRESQYLNEMGRKQFRQNLSKSCQQHDHNSGPFSSWHPECHNCRKSLCLNPGFMKIIFLYIPFSGVSF